MANPHFYWYDEPGKGLTALDTGRPLARLEEIPLYTVQDGKNGYGSAYRVAVTGGMRVRLVFQNVALTSSAGNVLENALRTLWGHLQRGGRCGFSRDHAKTFAGFSTSTSTRGASYARCGTNAFSAYSTSGALASGDPIVLETGNPDQRREYHNFSSAVGTQFNLSGTTIYNDLGSYMLRYKWFWPALYLPEDLVNQNPFSDQYRIHFTFDCTLEVDPLVYLLTNEETSGQALPLGVQTGSGVDYGGNKNTLDSLLIYAGQNNRFGGGSDVARLQGLLNSIRGRTF